MSATRVTFGPRVASATGCVNAELRLQYPIRPGQLLALLSTIYPALHQLEPPGRRPALRVLQHQRDLAPGDLIFDQDAVQVLYKGELPPLAPLRSRGQETEV